eukprot:146546_1
MTLMNNHKKNDILDHHTEFECKFDSKHSTNVLIHRLYKFGYSRADITLAMKHIKDKNNINDIIKYITRNPKSNNNEPQFNNTYTPFMDNKLPKNTDETNIIYNIDSLINSLPTSGAIKYHHSTSYWCIALPEKWQNESVNIAKLSSLFIKRTHNSEYNKSINICKSWANMINTNNKTPNIKCVTPPSVAGLHISLGSYKDIGKNDRPKNLIEGVNVSFKIKNIRIFPSIRKIPQNIEGQSTNNGLRYYPTLWVIADIDFTDFKFKTRYPPHISLACIAVQLNVNQVAKFEEINANK